MLTIGNDRFPVPTQEAADHPIVVAGVAVVLLPVEVPIVTRWDVVGRIVTCDGSDHIKMFQQHP
jgi:hypothetical protein